MGNDLEATSESPDEESDFENDDFEIDDATLAEIVETVAKDPEVATRLIIEAGFAGPLPPPNILAAYDDVVPGMAERILQMAEREQAHRHDVVGRVSRTEALLGPLGMASGLIVTIAFLLVSAWLIYNDRQIAGTILGTVDLLALVTLFVLRQRAADRDD